MFEAQDHWEAYDKELNVIIETAHQGKEPFVEWVAGELRYKLHFVTMTEECINTKDITRVWRAAGE